MRFDPTTFENGRFSTPATPAVPSQPRIGGLRRVLKEIPIEDEPTPARRDAPQKSAQTPKSVSPARRQTARQAQTAIEARAAARPNAVKPAEIKPLDDLGRAEIRTLMAIHLEGGEICVRREGDRLRYETVDEIGEVKERHPGSTVRALIAAGRLRFRRCAHGGDVFAVPADLEHRAAYWSPAKR